MEKIELIKAEQQILGFYHCYWGGTLKGLCEAMGLTASEYKQMVKDGMLDYLPEELGREILEIINTPHTEEN